MTDSVDWKCEILTAAERIRSYVRHTALDHSLELSDRHGANVYFKLESDQLTGSFKIRGAFNKLIKLQKQGKFDELSDGVPHFTCASTGNHAIACNHAMKTLDLKGKTFVPMTVSSGKEASLRKMGADIIKQGQDCVEGEMAARKAAEDAGVVFVSPYNDNDVAAGQGTIGVEIFADLPAVDVIFVPVGGGGLIAGIAAYLKAVKPDITIVGCQPMNDKVMYECVRAGKIIVGECKPTLSDGTAGNIEPGAITFDLCRDLVDEWVMVEENEIRDAVYFMVEYQHKVVEAAAGLAVGAYIKTAEKYKGRNVVIISCGSNISIQTLKHILNYKD